MKAATRMTCNRFIVALVVAAAVDVVHRPAVTTYCHAGRRCRGGRGQEDKRCWADKTCAKADNPFDAPRAAHVRPAAAPGNPVAYRTHAERVAQRRREWKLGRARKRAAGEQARAANATCYAKNYADLEFHFCKKGCNVGALLDHFRDHGRREGRSFGCVTVSAAERAKYPPPALSPRTHRFHPRAIIGIGGPPRQALLGGPIAGLNNAKEALFQLCRRGRKISYPTLRWNARVPNTPPLPSIPHEVLWDVDHWNAYVGVEIVVGSRSRCDSFRTGTTSATRGCRRSTGRW